MRKILTISLIAIHLFGNTDLVQLAGLSRLASHYHTHLKLNADLSFGDFLYMHYLGDDGTDRDDAQDRQLPFHNNDGHCLVNLFTALPAPLVHVFPAAVISVGNTYGTALQQIYHAEFLYSILRPPIDLA